jgi:hypothetical protein
MNQFSIVIGYIVIIIIIYLNVIVIFNFDELHYLIFHPWIHSISVMVDWSKKKIHFIQQNMSLENQNIKRLLVIYIVNLIMRLIMIFKLLCI